MEDYKVKVNNEAESKEVQDLLFELGYKKSKSCRWLIDCVIDYFATDGDELHCWDSEKHGDKRFNSLSHKEIKLQYLRDLVVLKRNDILDANYESGSGNRKYYLTNTESFEFINGTWVNIDEYVDSVCFKPINKECDSDMENLKVKTNNWDESKEVQELFIALGSTCGVEEITSKWVCLYNGQITFYDLLPNVDFKQITLQYLRDLVILKRNDVLDATHYYGGNRYYLTGSEFYQYLEGKWVNIDQYVDGMTFKKIGKELKVKNKDYLDTNYELRNVKQTSGDNRVPNGWIEVPEGAEEYRANYKSYKNNGELFYYSSSEWTKSSIMSKYKTLWQRNRHTTPNTSIQEKLKFIEKWLTGEKIQYILGVESDKIQSKKSQWHNFTEGAMQYIKRSDIKFREAPKYVTINGIEFRSVESLLKHVKNNFDLEDGE